MTLSNIRKLLLFGILISCIKERNSTRLKRNLDGEVSDEVSTDSDYSIFSTNLIDNLDLEEDGTISENERILNKTNSTEVSSQSIENDLTTISNETNDPHLLNFQSVTQEVTEENIVSENTVSKTNDSSYFDSIENTTVSSELSEISETTENHLEELTFDLDQNIHTNDGTDESTIQFTLENPSKYDDETTSSPKFDDDESSGDSEQIINFGSTDADDITTGIFCSDNEFQCDQKCISIAKKCDTFYDCDDHSDEEFCPTNEAETTQILFSTTTTKTEELKISITPGTQTDDGLVITIDERTQLNIQCTVTGSFEDLRAIIYKNQQVVSESETNTVNVIVNSVSIDQAGEYLCYGFPVDRSTYAAGAVKVVVRPTNVPSPTNVETIQANFGSQIEIPCGLMTYNNDRLQWRRLDKDIGNQQISYGKLYMYNLKQEDSGEYECFTNDGRNKRYRLIVNNPQAYQYQIRAYVENSDIDYRNGETKKQICKALTNGPELTIEWYDPYGQVIRDSNKFRVRTDVVDSNIATRLSTLELIDLQSNMAGEYKCRAVVNDQSESANFKLFALDDEKKIQTKVCSVTEATCRNGECIDKNVLCNGYSDCSDGSDEQNCYGVSTDGSCQPNEIQCLSRKCVQKIWVCDGENDCEDNTDEMNCPESKPEDKCKSHEFLCASGDQCVLKGFVCDGENDCNDLSDEIGCTQPVIMQGPTRNLTVVIGGTIEITCKATGFPEPFINWRLNWGHVCKEPRCFSQTINGEGKLTITDAVREDAGAYSCEALNSKGRRFAIPDAILTVYQSDEPRPCNCYGHSNQCDSNGNCIACQHNTYGRNCETCIAGYTGNPRIGTSNDCVPEAPRCQPNEFSTTINYPTCLPCFCNGLNVQCVSSSLVYNKIKSTFQTNDEDWKIIDDLKNEKPFSVDNERMVIVSSDFDENREYYFNAPLKFKGNKLASYGGNLSFTIRFDGTANERTRPLDIILSGSGLKLIYRHYSLIRPYSDNQVIVPILEESFRKFSDNEIITREYLLEVLSNIDELNIRASFIENQYNAMIGYVTLDYALDLSSSMNLDRMYRPKATAVEVCRCPSGYTGLSCESCAAGFQKAGAGSRQCVKQNENILVIDVPNSNLVLTPGATHVIHVTINGGGQVIWQKENEQQGYLPDGVMQSGNDLVITNARPEISGSYVCSIYTKDGEIKETIVINVKPLENEPPKIFSPNKQVSNVRIGDKFRLECVGQGFPIPSIRIETPYLEGTERIASLATMQRNPKASVEIDYFTESNSGEYRCIAENEYGQRAVEYFVVNVDNGSVTPPRITVEPKFITVKVGENVLIKTSYTGTEPVKATVELYAKNQAISNVMVNNNRNIEIRGVTKENEGQYIIHVKNDYGDDTDYFTIKVIEASGPKIYDIQNVIRIEEGSTLRLEPKVQYVGKAFFSWESPLEGRRNVIQSEHILTIPQVNSLNDGIYKLTLMDSTGETSVEVRVIVEERRKVTKRPHSMTPYNIYESQVIELDEDEGAMLLCSVKLPSSPGSIVFKTWSKASGRFHRNIRPNIERLQIISFKEYNQGDYICRVASSDGQKSEAIVTLQLRKDKPTEIQTTKMYTNAPYPTSTFSNVKLSANIDEDRLSHIAGENFEITCKVSGNPTPRIVWLFNNVRIADGQYQLYPRGEILYAREVTTELNGYITCRVIDQNEQYEEDSVLITIVQPSKAPLATTQEAVQSVSVNVEPSVATLNTGETLRLLCNVNINEGVNYNWMRKDRQPLLDNIETNGDQLIIRDARKLNEGSYVCYVYDRKSGIEHSAFADIAIVASKEEIQQTPANEPLQIKVEPEKAYVIQGQSAELDCNVVGANENVIITWKKNNQILDASRHIISNNGRKLKLVDVQLEDRGYFLCQAETINESVRSYATVEVEPREIPRVEIWPKQSEILVDIDSAVYAQCRVTAGSPSPVYEWKRADDRPLSKKIKIDQNGSLLSIQNAGSEEFGEYKCVAKNIAGTHEASIIIKERIDESIQGLSEDERRRQFEIEREAEMNRRRQEEEEENRRRLDEELRRQEEERRRQEDDEKRRRQEEENRNNLTPDVVTASTQAANEGQSVVLDCRTSKLDTAIYWLNPNNQYMQSINKDGSVIIANLKPSDAGTYICIVTNQYGTARSSLVLTVNKMSALLKVSLSPKSRRVAQGSNVNFNCVVENSANDNSVQWSRQSGEIIKANSVIDGKNLRLYNVQLSDSGRYQCGSNNDGAYSYDDAYLEVVAENNENNFPVIIQVKSEGFEPNHNAGIFNLYRFGVKMKVDCVPENHGDSRLKSIEWSKVEGIGADRHKQDRRANKNTLILEALSTMDLGVYVCIATKENGEVAQNEILFENHGTQGGYFHYKIKGPSETVVYEEEKITEETTPKQQIVPSGSNSPPKVKEFTQNSFTVTVGESFHRECEATGFPEPTINWTDGKGKSISSQNNDLSLSSLSLDDKGYYICIAKNSEGMDRQYFYLDIVPNGEVNVKTTTEEPKRGKKPFVTIKAFDTIGINENEKLTFACQVSDPNAQVQFIRTDKSMNEHVISKVSVEDKSIHLLEFNPFQAADIGSYVCRARNEYGIHSDTLIIQSVDGIFNFKTENMLNTSLAVNSNGVLKEGKYYELSAGSSLGLRRKRRQLENEIEYFTWTKFPKLPKSAISEKNKLNIQQFNDLEDNGLYFVRATTDDDRDFYGYKLVASNDFLLRENEYFSIEKDDEQTLVVKCRPNTNSFYTWKHKHSDIDYNDAYRIEGAELLLYKTDITNHFVCTLKVDPELGYLPLELEVNKDLLDRAFKKEITQKNYDEREDYYDIYDDDPEDADIDCIQGYYYNKNNNQLIRNRVRLYFEELAGRPYLCFDANHARHNQSISRVKAINDRRKKNRLICNLDSKHKLYKNFKDAFYETKMSAFNLKKKKSGILRCKTDASRAVSNNILTKNPTKILNNSYPKIKLAVRNNSSLIFDARFQIDCITSFSDNVLSGGYSIEWLRNDRKMPSRSYMEGHSLIINRFDHSDLGEYSCVTKSNSAQLEQNILFYENPYGSISYKIY